MIADEVKQELKALDRQYSYEHTVQLGRYHKDSDDEENTSIRERRRDSTQKKSVRFHGTLFKMISSMSNLLEYDPREEFKKEKEDETLRVKFYKWRNQIKPGYIILY